MDNRQRKELQDALAAGLLLLYQGSASEALVHLNATETEIGITPAARQRINQFASERAQLVQDGVNSRMDAARADSDPSAVAAAQAGIDSHNQDVLIPFMTSWALHEGLRDAYDTTPAADGSGQSATEATLWAWQQNTSFEDSCSSAEAASPAPRDELEAIAGGPAPVHEGCQCDEYPVS